MFRLCVGKINKDNGFGDLELVARFETFEKASEGLYDQVVYELKTLKDWHLRSSEVVVLDVETEDDEFLTIFKRITIDKNGKVTKC